MGIHAGKFRRQIGNKLGLNLHIFLLELVMPWLFEEADGHH